MGTVLEIARTNLVSPPVLAFAAGALLAAVRSGVRLPAKLYTALSTVLLCAIGLKGGLALAGTALSTLWRPAAATIALGVLAPCVAYGVVRRMGRLGVVDSAAIAAHYGSVSIVTFTAALGFLSAMNVVSEGYMPALVALLEIPGIAVALLIAGRRSGDGGDRRSAVREVLGGKTIVVLSGGMAAGFAAGAATGTHAVPGWFTTAFALTVAVFLLEMGMVAAARLRDFRQAGSFLACFAVLMPLAMGLVGTLLARAAGLSVGGAALLATMAASASYIAAPAAVRIALPGANPAYYVTTSLGITFPFNLVFGIPIYLTLAEWIA